MSELDIGLAQSDEEREAFAEAVAQSLGFPRDIDWLPRYATDDVRIVVVRMGGEVVGGCALIDMGQWFGGRPVPMVGVNGVGVFPEHRGRRVAGSMMRWVVEDTRARGFPLSGLYPATQPVYRRVGYEQAGTWIQYEIPIDAIAGKDRELDVTPTGLHELELLKPVYEQACKREPGKLDRTIWGWTRILEPVRGKAYSYRVGQGDGVEGYVVFTHGTSPRGWGYDLRVSELIANTEAARRRIFSLLYDHRSMAKRVYLTGPPSLPELLRFPEQGAKLHDLVRWTIRVTDVAGALQARGYSPHTSASVVMEVTDDLLPDNGGVYSVSLSGGAVEVTRGGAPTMRLDVNALASLFTGHFSAEQLAATGMVDGDAESLAAASAIFAGPAPWLPEIY